MAAVGTVHLIWEGGEHDFCLSGIGSILALETNCGDVGLMEILRRLQNDTWKLSYVREPIRIGLIGGGMKPEPALQLVKACVDNNANGLAPSVILAIAILTAVVIGVPKDDPVGKKPAVEDETGQDSTTRMAASAARQPTDSEPL